MATGGHEQTSDEIFNFQCTPCAKANKHREAVKYCVECQGYCCQSCVDVHSLFPTLVAHKLLDKSNFKSSKLKTDLPSIPTELCSAHKVKTIDMYCGDHDEVGCSSCMVLKHRNCTKVKVISDVVDIIFNISDADEIDRKLNEKKLTLLKIKNSRESLLGKLNKSKTEVVQTTRKFRKELETILKKLETETIKELEMEYEKVKSILEEQKKTSEDEIDRMKQASGELKQAEGKKAQQFVSFKMAQKNIFNSENILRSLETSVNEEIHFSGNTDLRNFLQQLSNLGSISRNTLYSVIRTKELNIKMQNDTSTCYVYGSCLTEDEKLLLADSYNRKLKRAYVVKQYLIYHCELAEGPTSVCCVSRNEAVVTQENSIQFVSLGNQMTPTRKLKLDHTCFGIAFINETLYITDNKKSLFVHDMTGNLLQAISSDSFGKEIFTQCRQIAFGDFSDKIFIADRQNKFIILDKGGTFVSSLKDSGLNNGTRVCTDKRGNVFVCGKNSKNIVLFSESGTEIGTVVQTSDKLNHAWSLAFYPLSNTLCVTEFESDAVKLFMLQ